MVSVPVDVFVLNPHEAGSIATQQFSDADVAWLFNRANKYSFARYWEEVSGGLFEIQPNVHPHLSVAVTSHQMSELCAQNNDKYRRRKGATLAMNLLASGGRRGTSGGRAVIFLGGVATDAGSTGLVFDDVAWTVSYLHMDSSHSFMAHEIGHVLGLDEDFDLRLPGPLGEQQYGNPADIMSALRWANSVPAPTFAVPPSERGFASPTLWGECGPGASPANFFRYRADYPAVPTWASRIAADSPPQRLKIMASDAPLATGARLVVMPSTDRGAAWYTVQYKAKRDWDSEIYPSFGDVTGVVQVHELRTVRWPPDNDGHVTVETDQPCLVAEIPVPGGDRDWSNGRISLEVHLATPQFVSVTVGHWLGTGKSLSMDVTVEDTFAGAGPTFEVIEVSRTGPNCQPRTYEVQRTSATAKVSVQLSSTGYAHPVFKFEANGVPLGNWSDSVDVQNIPVTMTRPTSLGHSIEEATTTHVTYEKAGRILTVKTLPDEGSYEINLVAYVSEAPGSNAGVTTATQSARIITRSVHLPPEAIRDQAECIRASMQFERLDERPGDRPPVDEGFRPGVEVLESGGFRISPGVSTAATAARRGSRLARRLMLETAQTLKVSPEALDLALHPDFLR